MRRFLLLSVIIVTGYTAYSQCPAETFPSSTNLVVNGDFSAGNSGFNSGYTYTASSGGCNTPNHYAIGTNPNFYNNTYQGSSASGSFLIANGTSSGSVWCQTISVDPSTIYSFTALVASFTTTSPAVLQFKINGVQICSNFTAPSALFDWSSFQCSWNSGAATTANICIYDINNAGSGNDFGLDNIMFQECICQLAATAGPDVSMCGGGTITLNASGGNTYLWDPSTGLSDSTIANPTVTVDTTTVFHVTVSNASTGCMGFDSVTVTIHPVPQVVASPDTLICEGASVTLNASGGGSYQWSNGSTSGTTVVNPTTSTWYVVSSTNAFGCTGSDSVLVSVHDFNPAVSGGATICASASAVLVASGGTSYLWSNGSTNDSIIVNPSSTTTYSVTISDTMCGKTLTVTVTVNPLPVANAGNDASVCDGHSTTLNASGGGSYNWSGGLGSSSTVTVTPDSTTTYYVTVTSAAGCSSTDSVKITVLPVPNLIADGDTTVCSASPVILTASGGTNYQWSNGSTNDSTLVNISSTTTFSVTTTAANGCSDTAFATISIHVVPVTLTGTTPICVGDSAVLVAGGGNSYQWSNGSTNDSIVVYPTSDSTYAVIITDAMCSAQASIDVTVNPLPITNAGPDVSVCAGNSAILNASGGGSYSWSNGGSSSQTTVNPADTTIYFVTVTNAAGCKATDSVTVSVMPLPIITVAGGGTICPGDTTTLSASGGTSYQWSNGSSNDSIVVNPSSTTTYSVTGTDANGCSASASVSVSVHQVAASVSSGVPICLGDSAVLVVSGGNGYQWSNGSTNDSIVVYPSSDSTFTVLVSDSVCSQQLSISVSVNQIPSANAGADTSVCFGSSAILNASGGGSYSWNTGDNTSQTTVNPSDTTTYYVTVTDANGCISTDSAKVSVMPLPVVTVSGGASICAGDSVTLSASGGTGYQWSNGASGDTIIVIPGSSTTYTVQVTDSNGCSNNASVSVDVHVVNATIKGDHLLCIGEATFLYVEGGNTYQWNTGATTDTIYTQPNADSTYTVLVSDSMCSVLLSYDVTVNPLPVADAGNDTAICLGNFIIMTASGGTNYNWSNGLGNDSTAIVNPTDTSTYYVVATDANGCQSIDSITVNTLPLPNVTASGDTTICPGASVMLIANGSGNISWNNGNSGDTIIVSPSSTTSYTVVTTDSNGCSSSADVIVNVDQINLNITGDSTICFGDQVTLSIDNGLDGMWSTGENGSTITVSPTEDSTYYVLVSDGICSALDSFNISVAPLPVIDAWPTDTINYGSSIQINATDGYSYEWIPPAHLSCTTCESPIASPLQTTTYYVYVTDENGCEVMDSLTIYVTYDEIVTFPNAFSPNGDGVNDLFHALGNGLVHLNYLRVYNRWGEVIFETDDIHQGWDGTYKGEPAEVGVYVYTCSAHSIVDGTKYSFQGNITLVR